MDPRKYRTNNPKNAEYDTRPDGSLLCGPGCFSSINVLKKRFTSKSKADAAMDYKARKDQEVYACEYCQGFHTTSRKKGKK